jgi:MFS family permease
VIGQISIGHFSDRFGREWAWMISSLGFAFCYVLLLVMKSYPSLTLMYLMVAAQGLLGYGMSSIYGAMPAELFQGKRYGAIFGMFGVASGIGSSAGPWITGLIYDQSGSYAGAFYFALALSAVSIVCVWFAAPRNVRLVAGQAERRARRQSKSSEPRPSVVQSS